MTAGAVRYEVDEGIAVLTLDRPDVRNALGIESARELAAAIEKASGDESVRLLLLDAEGPAFCAGMDLKSVDLADATQAGLFAAALATVYERLITLPKPVLCAVDGPVSGGGVGLPAAADLVWAGPRAKFSLPETRLGLVPALVSVPLKRRISAQALRRMAVGGLSHDGARAVSEGLADFRAEVSAAVEARAFAKTLLADHAPEAVARTKRFLGRKDEMALRDELAEARIEFEDAVCTPEARKGLDAFRRKEFVRWDT